MPLLGIFGNPDQGSWPIYERSLAYVHAMDDTWIGTWGWVTLALVNAGLAQQKNRSRLAWFLGSLILGPVATAIIVISASVPEEDERLLSNRGADEPGVALLGSGLIVLVLSALPAIGASAVDEPLALWILTAVAVAIAATLIVLHVLVRRRWKTRRLAALKIDA